jgi:hypothetical protein
MSENTKNSTERIVIVGFGWVGQANAIALTEMGQEVFFYDVLPPRQHYEKTHKEAYERIRPLKSPLDARFPLFLGVLYDSFTKVDYTVDGDNKSMKDKQWHGLNQIRYGLYGRFGISGFSVFMYYNLSPMFQTNKGPDYSDMNSVTMGISINGF